MSLEFLFTPGSSSDISTFRHFQFDRLKGTKVYGDGAYIDHQFEGLLKKAYQIELVPKRKKNSVRKNTSEDELFLVHHRGRIETTFSEITALMPRNIQAKTSRGFLLKVMFFILGYTVKRSAKQANAA